MNVVSLFDGISCGRAAFERAGIKVSGYAAFEIDKYAKSISRYNYPDIIQCGDVLAADFNDFTNYNMVIGGSPCTFWSIAKNNREVDKSGMGWKLFMRFADAVRQIKPKFFLYENVASMPQNIKEYISQELGVLPILINSALVSAQQRKRLYWTNIQDISQPQDKGILLQDMLESGITCREKSHCIDACYYKGGNHSSPHKQSGKRCMVYEPIALADKAQTIPATIYKENALSMLKRGKTGLFCVLPVGAALRTRENEAGKFKHLEVRNDGKINAITSVLTDSCICEPVRVGTIGKGGQGNRIYSVRGKSVSISANSGGLGSRTGLYKIDLPDGDYIVRKLTTIEAERCQTLHDNYTALGVDDTGKTVKISDTQRYKCIGNGWTVDAITHILKHIKEEREMYDLTIIKQNGGAYIDSREVAVAIGKRHDNLLRDIDGYLKIFENSNVLNFEGVNFFIKSSYLDAKGESRPCYLISKMGCEVCAHKLTGERGVLFTAAYVTRFNELEATERAELEKRAAKKTPRLGECNAAARIIVRSLQNMGAASERIVGFLKDLYEPFGISVVADDDFSNVPQTYTAKQIAKMCGIYSLNGNPHYQAVSCILNENIFIGEEHRTVLTTDYGNHIGISVRYDQYAAQAVDDWLAENAYPSEVYGFERTYYVLYDFHTPKQ